MNKSISELLPERNSSKISWDKIENSPVSRYIGPLIESKQNRFYHGEGNAWNHTKMVCEELLKLDEYHKLNEKRQDILFTAALLHDLGKATSTRLIRGKWSAPKHAQKGARLVRDLLWREFSLNGTKEDIEFRETVTLLTKYHFLPLYINDRKNPELDLARIASNQELLPDFSVEMLCLLEEADLRGRITPVQAKSLEAVEQCRKIAEGIGCYDRPMAFPDDYSQFAYLQGLTDKIEKVKDNHWGEITLMAGLPASGKDYWIASHCKDTPVISLDDIREEINVSPRAEQGPVVELAFNRARDYLERQIPFIWNATNLNFNYRKDLLSFIHAYNAKTKIEYLETDRDVELKRNRERKAEVPERAINQMLKNMSIPERYEATEVSYNVT